MVLDNSAVKQEKKTGIPNGMGFTVLTLFPELITSFFNHGIIGRAMEKKLIVGDTINIRDFTLDRHKSVDDKPYGGGCGMVMTPEPLFRAIDEARSRRGNARVLLMSPQGKPFDQSRAREFAAAGENLIFVCGRYEGIDERVYHGEVDEEISIGDYVMTGGELAAMVIVDAVTRLLPGVLGGESSAELDSFENHRLEHAHYTRPFEFEGMTVPEVLLSGNHGEIEKWRRSSSLKRTFIKRPDLFHKETLSAEEKACLKIWCRELEALVKE
ncbi:tRNA (Guanine37-N(1)-) methyltransferase [Desulfocicer vacuolatum DSM 3385]|uniref:tRNA (guanine-N(1)-)-methyltransferase n=2 Tax=Desulfocicer vacuolatum TaxID=2298 RepID=A0A1W2CTY6_9BACT|nr:tRNA (guanosine(37)-N1)-methyltransferase TrmD [Desulfocicer vacuolatum]SMC88108.1 tRNA (Guanine37-N(1)-) methyltransferase [Desulfocicer vacuolatum DSM 3385]